jgi:N-acetylglutamate synthase-like GNAT family acetyltransferase
MWQRYEGVILKKFTWMTVLSDPFEISTDRNRLDIDFIHQFLTRSYWAEGISRELVERCVNGSLCFGIYEGSRQVGFARMVTDRATFAYMADVFIDEAYRGRGLSKSLVEAMMAHPDLQGLRRMMLATKDAHGLYARFGFTPVSNPERLMQIVVPDIYKKRS